MNYTINFTKRYLKNRAILIKSLNKIQATKLVKNIYEVTSSIERTGRGPMHLRDHPLRGKMKDLRSCHIGSLTSDLELIYKPHPRQGDTQIIDILDLSTHPRS